MFILGLTGSIGSGKSTAAAMLRRMFIAVHDADAAVHQLTGPGGAAVAEIEAAFPGVVADGAVDRAALGARVLGDDTALVRLEAILHPMVRQATYRFLAINARRQAALVVLDVPLLFETGGDARCDAVAVVHCSPGIQRRRVLARPGMNATRYAAILARQMPAAEKLRRADFPIQTGLGKKPTLWQLAEVVKLVSGRKGRAWPGAWMQGR